MSARGRPSWHRHTEAEQNPMGATRGKVRDGWKRWGGQEKNREGNPSDTKLVGLGPRAKTKQALLERASRPRGPWTGDTRARSSGALKSAWSSNSRDIPFFARLHIARHALCSLRSSCAGGTSSLFIFEDKVIFFSRSTVSRYLTAPWQEMLRAYVEIVTAARVHS